MPAIKMTEEAFQFADSIYSDLATQVEGDQEKMVRFWKTVKFAVDQMLKGKYDMDYIDSLRRGP